MEHSNVVTIGDTRLEFMQIVTDHPGIEYALFELSLMQDGVLAAIMDLPMERAQTLLWRENINKLASFLKKALPFMKESVASQLQIELERKDFKVAIVRLLKYIKDTRYALRDGL
jgi:hypothetical protein